MLSTLRQSIEAIFKDVGVENPIEFSTPPKPEMGDLAFACFNLAKQSGKKPNEIAVELAEKINKILSEDSLINKTQAFGPYLNIFFKPEAVVSTTVSEVIKKKKKFGHVELGFGKKVMIEYPSNNTHKEFHIGHLRNVCIGNSLVKLYENAGYRVYPVNYLNDFGAHVAKCLWGLQKFHANEKIPKNKQKWLGEIYAEASKYLKEHEEVAEEVASIQKKLEAGDKEIWPLFMKTRKWSMDKFVELFKELGVKHAAVFYEKDIKADGQKKVDELIKKGVATVGEGGAIIVDLSPYKLDIALVRKSNGVGLYLTSDLPLADKKFKKYQVDESIVITGEEQKFYFKQLYKILELLGEKRKLTHISYGLINLPEGKMSSRTGNVILYENLRDQVMESMVEETSKRHENWSAKKIKDTASILTQAALKFDIQKHEAVKNIVFDIKEATAFEGFSGPYVLYTIARINSLVGKAKKEKIKTNKKFNLLVTSDEKALALQIGDVEDVLKKALENYNPSVVARFAFELAQSFNNFYNKQKVVDPDNKDVSGARLSLALAAQQTLQNLLSVLTIGWVDEM